jgi:hypothetical protein
MARRSNAVLEGESVVEEADLEKYERFIGRLLTLANERDPDLYAVVLELVIKAAGDEIGIDLTGIDKKPH